VPLALTHRILGQLVGARRPTVSTALGELAERNELNRRADGSWLLRGDPPTASSLGRRPAPAPARGNDLLRPARRFARGLEKPVPPPEDPEREELLMAVERLRGALGPDELRELLARRTMAATDRRAR